MIGPKGDSTDAAEGPQPQEVPIIRATEVIRVAAEQYASWPEDEQSQRLAALILSQHLSPFPGPRTVFQKADEIIAYINDNELPEKGATPDA